LFGDAGKDILDATAGRGENRLYGGKGDDTLFAGVNDQLFGGNGDDILFAGDRDNRLTGGDGKDQFWLVAGDIPGAANTHYRLPMLMMSWLVLALPLPT